MVAIQVKPVFLCESMSPSATTPTSGFLADDHWLTLILVLYAFGVAIWPVAAGLEATFDDGYYYLQIARNLAGGEGSSFDGLSPTNGYHPLWLLILAPIMRLAPDGTTALTFANLLQAALAAGAAALVFRIARLALGRLAGVFATVLWIDLTYRLSLSGLEYAVHSVCLLLTILVYLVRHGGRQAANTADSVLLGLCCTLTVLARLDAVLLAPLLALVVFSRGGLRRLIAFAAPVVVACGAYAVVNLIYFGHLSPISAAVKRDWSETLLTADPIYASHGWLLAKALNVARPLFELFSAGDSRALGLGVAGGLIWLVATFVAARGSAGATSVHTFGFFRPRWIALWVTFSLLQNLICGLFYHESMSYRPWYFVCQPWLGAVLAATAVEWLLRARTGQKASFVFRRGVSIACSMLCLMVVAHTVRGLIIWNSGREPTAFREAAAWAASNLPADATIGSWNAGTLGYWSERRVVNLDGLVNSWEFFERGRDDLCSYWTETGITHVIDAYREGEFLTLMPTHSGYEHCADRLELLMEQNQNGEPWSIRAYRVPSLEAGEERNGPGKS